MFQISSSRLKDFHTFIEDTRTFWSSCSKFPPRDSSRFPRAFILSIEFTSTRKCWSSCSKFPPQYSRGLSYFHWSYKNILVFIFQFSFSGLLRIPDGFHTSIEVTKTFWSSCFKFPPQDLRIFIVLLKLQKHFGPHISNFLLRTPQDFRGLSYVYWSYIYKNILVLPRELSYFYWSYKNILVLKSQILHFWNCTCVDSYLPKLTLCFVSFFTFSLIFLLFLISW